LWGAIIEKKFLKWMGLVVAGLGGVALLGFARVYFAVSVAAAIYAYLPSR
jgi:hypothetical protein